LCITGESECIALRLTTPKSRVAGPMSRKRKTSRIRAAGICPGATAFPANVHREP